jgi:hypothetical protein
MALNKVIWQQALAHYRAWNEAEFIDQVRDAGKKTPEEKWREYQALFAFGRRLRPEPSPAAQRQTAREWEYFYEQIRRFEARRKTHG